MKKPTVKQVEYAAMALWLAGALTIFIGVRLDREAVCVIVAAVVVLTFAGHIALCRCPHCGRYLGRVWGDRCQFCGKPLDGE